jgi:three-Cys-motif partner protein
MTDQFAKDPSEWTLRKHALAGRYMVPAAMKMKDITRKSMGVGRIALIDGYAGPNKYKDTVRGSTKIMVEAARKVRAQGSEATVYACEHDPDHPELHDQLRENLADAIAEGILKTYPLPHAEAIPLIQAEIGDMPALVFLDPQTVEQMTLADDIRPWATRARTDVLGIFMGGQACRVCPQKTKGSIDAQRRAEAALGAKWREASTIERAYEVFFAEITTLKQFAALYRLRKQEPKSDAYGVFGLSDSPDGFWLLSDAVAKDWGTLKEFDASKASDTLFTAVDREEEETESFEQLVELVRPIVLESSSLRSDPLGIEMFRRGVGIQEAFGRYTGPDFTNAALKVLGRPLRKKRNAKTIEH